MVASGKRTGLCQSVVRLLMSQQRSLSTFSQNKSHSFFAVSIWRDAMWMQRALMQHKAATLFSLWPPNKGEEVGNQTLDMSRSFRWPRSLEAPAGASNRGERTELTKGRKIIVVQYLEAYSSVQRGWEDAPLISQLHKATGSERAFLNVYTDRWQGISSCPVQPRRPQKFSPEHCCRQRVGRGYNISDLHWGGAGIEFGQGHRLYCLRFLVVILSRYTQKLR